MKFGEKMAVVATAISFLIIIVSVAIADGFKVQIRGGLADLAGDVQVSSDNPFSADEPWVAVASALPGVEKVSPAVYRAAVVKNADDIQGVMVKGVETSDTTALGVRIPRSLSRSLQLKEGDGMLTYFIGEKVKVRKFTVTGIYDPLTEAQDKMVVYADINDMRRLNGWEEDGCSAMEFSLAPQLRDRKASRRMDSDIQQLSGLPAKSLYQRYSTLFDWLELIDMNVLAILVLMIIVAGFNMISGLLILLFRSTSTIGTLKSMGMTDKGIASVFLRLSARHTLLGMLLGNAAALLFCLVQGTTHLIKLNPANYFVPFVPVSVNVPMIILADAIAFGVIMLLLLIPTLFISKVDPARTVRVR